MDETQPEEIAIRKANSNDASLVISLILGLAAFEKLDPPDTAAQQRLVADAFGPHPRFEVFLAEAEGKIAGYAFIFETYSTFLALPSLYLEDLFVLPEFRGKRVGYALMLFLAREAVKRGCGRMEWTVLDWNRHAIEFYKRLGGQHLEEWYHYRFDRPTLERLAAL
ncbi:MAG: GNAT family N-acetyltransferase [Chloroflexota bacterium]